MLKTSIIITLIALTLTGLYFGAYMPLKKAQTYIAVARALPTYGTFQNVVEKYDAMFNLNSPVGQREAVKFFLQDVMGIIRQEQQGEEVSKLLVEYVGSKINEHDVIHNLHMAYAYSALWRRFQNKEYFDKAESYFQKVLEVGPKLPHSLNALLELYARSGNLVKAKEIGEVILEYWPDNQNVRDYMEKISATMGLSVMPESLPNQ